MRAPASGALGAWAERWAASPRLALAVAGCLLAGAAALWPLALQPAQARLERARMQLAAAHAVPRALRTVAATPHGQLWREERFPDVLAQALAGAAESGLRLDEGAYRVTRESAGPLARYQIQLPVRGDYVQLRRYLAGLSASLPGLALERVQFERPKVGDAALDARLGLVLFMERAR
jgi:hypothetical protein